VSLTDQIGTTEEIARALSDYFATCPASEGLAAAYLFGSFARGSAGPASDVDVGVLYAAPPPATLTGLGFHLEADLARLLHRPVQLVVLNRAPVDLVQRVLRDGRLVLDRDRSCRIRFEVQTRNEFWDLQPFLLRYRKAGEQPQ
jgi:uncharacterized protein